MFWDSMLKYLHEELEDALEMDIPEEKIAGVVVIVHLFFHF